ncbi:hypothetical protein [Bacteroides sp. 519]|uniref:hypothetical protein n=1 Tax=Bacteroides sp. 519 TaxID=2302937 RepID=UPI0013CFBA93|nr:hypothetical protein [Bacteroides sp. 519]NDV58702.1 hypothetical protein [Bacteroides sp. 519]
MAIVEYDSNNNIIKESKYDKRFNLLEYTVYEEYDESNRYGKKTNKLLKENKTKTYSYNYYYDAIMNSMEYDFTYYIDGKKISETTGKIQYDDYGNYILQEIITEKNGEKTVCFDARAFKYFYY